MTDIVINRWKNYGKDRGYAALADGTKLGWIDLLTGAVTVEAGADGPAVASALTAWARATVPAQPAEPGPFDLLAQPAPDPTGSTAESSVGEHQNLDEIFASLPDLTTYAAPEPPAVATAQEPAHPAWTDLAKHRPGQLVREQAVATWEADKADSKLFAYGARLFDVKTQERAWRVGAKGEEIVGNRLEELESRGWYILHSIPVGNKGSDIDHVAIGPGGVFTFNTKRHPNAKIWIGKHQIRVNGTPTDYLRNSRFEATRASKKLSAALGLPVDVTPCIVLSGAPAITVKQKPEDVMVVTSQDVPRMFKRRRAVLTAQDVAAIYAVARRSDTWV